MSEITHLLKALGHGDVAARAQLLPIVYEELRTIARSRMAREPSDHTLQATALVHEAYLKLLGGQSPQFEDRGHFFAVAAEAMRQILIDHARRKKALKHGGGRRLVEFDDELINVQPPCDNLDDLLSLSEALDRLAATLPEEASLIKLLYFAGLNLAEAAGALNISRTTAYRRWRFARAWLFEAMSGRSE